MRHSFNQEHIIGVLCIAIGAVVLGLTKSFPGGTAAAEISGPAFFPNTLSYILILMGIYEILHGMYGKSEKFHSFAAIWAGMKTREFCQPGDHLLCLVGVHPYCRNHWIFHHKRIVSLCSALETWSQASEEPHQYHLVSHRHLPCVHHHLCSYPSIRDTVLTGGFHGSVYQYISIACVDSLDSCNELGNIRGRNTWTHCHDGSGFDRSPHLPYATNCGNSHDHRRQFHLHLCWGYPGDIP